MPLQMLPKAQTRSVDCAQVHGHAIVGQIASKKCSRLSMQTILNCSPEALRTMLGLKEAPHRRAKVAKGSLQCSTLSHAPLHPWVLLLLWSHSPHVIGIAHPQELIDILQTSGMAAQLQQACQRLLLALRCLLLGSVPTKTCDAATPD